MQENVFDATQCNKSLGILHQNIAGVLNKQVELYCAISDLELNGTYLDIVCTSETNIMRGSEFNLKLKNFKVAASYSRKNSNRGGVAILVRKNLEFNILRELENISEPYGFECCGIEVIKYGLVIICIYTNKTPSSTSSIFFKKLNDVLDGFCLHKRKKYIICGDLNIDTMKSTKISSELIRMLETYNLHAAITGPTRISAKSNTCIDHIFTNIDDGQAVIHDLGLSDHTAQSFHMPIKKRHPPPIKWWYEYRRDYSHENQIKFKKCLSSLKFKDVFDQCNASCAFSSFYSLFILFYKLCFPLIKIKMSNKKINSKYLSKGIKKSCFIKRGLYLKSRHCKSYRSKYKKYSTILKKCILSLQKSANMKYIASTDNTCKAVWEVIKKYTTSDCINKIIDNLTIDNKDITDPQLICETFNNYFIDIVKDNCSPSLTLPNELNINNVESSIFLNPVGVQELLKITRELKNSHSVGYDDVRTDVVKDVISIIAEPFLHAINLSLSQGIFPELLKKSIVKPLFKKDDKSKIDNYRPITLIPIFSKILEKIIYNRFIKFLDKNNVITEEQHGFRKNRSTSLATFKLMKNVINCIDEKVPVTVLFLDMSKAFDFVSHELLILKLSKYGIRGPAIEWIKSYLYNREQCVQIKSYCPKTNSVIERTSSYAHNNFGVPQGSILGPLLFLLYINDLPKHVSHECILFADDTSLIIKSNDLRSYNDDINRTLSQTIAWLAQNNLKININKTKYIQFRTTRGHVHNLNISHNGEYLEEVSETNFLGLNIDCHCSWNNHINKLCSKVNRFVYALRKVSRLVSVQAAITAYNGYVDSILRYGIVLWGNSVDLQNLFIIQKRCIRAMFAIKKTDSCQPLFKKYSILPLPCLYIYEICLFVYKHKYLFENKRDVTHRRIRSQYLYKLFRPPVKLTLSSRNSFIMCIDIYNKLPDYFKETDMNVNMFKKRVKAWLLENCYYSVKDFLEHKNN